MKEERSVLFNEILMLNDYLCNGKTYNAHLVNVREIINDVKNISNILIYAYENEVECFSDLRRFFSSSILNIYKAKILAKQEYVRVIDTVEKIVISKYDYEKLKFINEKITQLDEQFREQSKDTEIIDFDSRDVNDETTNLNYFLCGCGIFRVKNYGPLKTSKLDILSNIDGENLTVVNNINLDCNEDVELHLQEGIKEIETDVFCMCKGIRFIKNIYIPKTVDKIATGCFMGSNIENIVIDSQNPTYRCEGNCIIERATNTLVAVAKNFTIPNNVNKIADGAFSFNDNISHIKLPVSVNIIGAEAFSNCSKLEEVEVSSKCSIGKNAFQHCKDCTIKFF